MARRVRALSLAISLGFMVVALALGYWQVLRADDVLARATNPRLVEEERRLLRGRILDRNGEVLARSERAGELAHRIYSYPPLAHVTGYASTRHGKTGVEESFDAFLRGARGTDALTRLQNRLLRSDQLGADIVLTIDLRLQRAADEALGDATGAIVALDVASGEMLALASHPYFDANNLDETWQQVLNDPAKPLVHRALQGQYVPGSVFKVVTASAAIDLGIADPDERHHHEGDLIVDGFRIRNTNHPQLRDLTFAEEFAWSCNPVFALTGLSLGLAGHVDFNVMALAQPYVFPRGGVEASVERFRDYAGRFGIGQRVPLELPTAAGRLSTGSTMSRVELASTAFGQGDLQVSPLQMALAAAAISSGGTMPAAHLTVEARDQHGSAVPHRPADTARRVISASTAAAMNRMMVLSVDTAYAQPARIPGVRVGGKTGTAEVGNGAAPHAWFVGYAPADRPGVAVAVIMENRGSGTTHATPAARKVLETALQLGY